MPRPVSDRSETGLAQPILDARDPLVRALLVGRSGRRAANTDRADHVLAGTDRHAATEQDHAIDLRKTKVRDVFRGRHVDAVIHLGVLHDPRASQDEHHAWNVEGFARLLDYVAAYDVKKLVAWKQRVVERLTGGIGTLFKTWKVEHVAGTAKFVAPTKLEVTSSSGTETI